MEFLCILKAVIHNTTPAVYISIPFQNLRSSSDNAKQHLWVLCPSIQREV
jgi:hypothetical protein